MKTSVIKCDRCGETESENGSMYARVILEKSSKIKTPNRYRAIRGTLIKKDLCPACEFLLEEFLRGEPPPELVPALVRA